MYVSGFEGFRSTIWLSPFLKKSRPTPEAHKRNFSKDSIRPTCSLRS